MNDFEMIHNQNRNRIVFNVIDLVYGRHPKFDEIRRINLMLDNGNSISDILKCFRTQKNSAFEPCFLVDPVDQLNIHDLPGIKNNFSHMRTPLEMCFHEYVIK